MNDNYDNSQTDAEALARFVPTIRILANGTPVEVDERGKASFISCGWLVDCGLAPEPTSADDRIIRACGARLTHMDEQVGSWACANGHSYRGLEAEWAEDAMREQFERSHSESGGEW